MPRTWLETATNELADDGDAVRPVQSNGTDVEDGRNGDVGTESDQVDGGAEDDRQPDGNDRGVGALVNDLPVLGSWEQTIAREGEDGTGQRLNGNHADGVDDEESAHSEDDGTLGTKVVLEDLNDGLFERAGKDFSRVTHGESQDDGKEPADDVSQSHGDEDGPRGLGLWLVDLFSNMCGGIVISHGP